MTISDDAIAAAFHCEAKLYSFRNTKSGTVVSFEFDAAHVPPQIALALVGTRYTLALVQRGDNEEPITPDPVTSPESRPPSPDTGNGSSAGAHIKDPVRSMAAKARYDESDDMQKAVARANMLPSDPQFQAWAAKRSGLPANADVAASVIRAECGVNSRKEIGMGGRAYRAFLSFETEFDFAVGRLPEPR